jgi:hypothetical protein
MPDSKPKYETTLNQMIWTELPCCETDELLDVLEHIQRSIGMDHFDKLLCEWSETREVREARRAQD